MLGFPIGTGWHAGASARSPPSVPARSAEPPAPSRPPMSAGAEPGLGKLNPPKPPSPPPDPGRPLPRGFAWPPRRAPKPPSARSVRSGGPTRSACEAAPPLPAPKFPVPPRGQDRLAIVELTRPGARLRSAGRRRSQASLPTVEGTADHDRPVAAQREWVGTDAADDGARVHEGGSGFDDAVAGRARAAAPRRGGEPGVQGRGAGRNDEGPEAPGTEGACGIAAPDRTIAAPAHDAGGRGARLRRLEGHDDRDLGDVPSTGCSRRISGERCS